MNLLNLILGLSTFFNCQELDSGLLIVLPPEEVVPGPRGRPLSPQDLSDQKKVFIFFMVFNGFIFLKMGTN